MSRERVLFIRSGVDPGPYRSLERVESSTRDALAGEFDLIEPKVHPSAGGEGFLDQLPRLRPFDAIIDLSDGALQGPVTADLPSIYFALGNMPNGGTFSWLRRSRLKTTDVLLLTCTSDLRIHAAIHGADGLHPEVLPLGIDLDRFHPRGAEVDNATRRELGVPADAFVLLHAGRLNVQKNVHSALALLRELVSRDQRMHLVLAGDFDTIAFATFDVDNQGYEESIRADIARWGLGEHVHFAGKLGDEDLARAYSAADLFVSFTLHNNENFGYAPVEAMACGTPAVGSHFGGLKDTILHGRTGYHVETLMTDHGLRCVWRQAIEPIRRLAAEPSLRRRMGAAGIERCRRHYGLASYRRRLGDIIRAAIERARHRPGLPGHRFHFAPQSMRLHLTNLYGTWRRSEGRPRHRAHGQPRVEYDVYRWFQGPYATRDVRGLGLSDVDRLTLLTRCWLDRSQGLLRSRDPIWPRDYELSPAELDTVSAIEPGVRVADVVAAGEAAGSCPAATRALLERLLGDGVVYPEHAFPSLPAS